jgi:hypothetical protein
MSGTAPAWQVRDMQRNKVIADFKRMVLDAEDHTDAAPLHRAMLYTLLQIVAGEKMLDLRMTNDIPAHSRGLGAGLAMNLYAAVEKFQRSEAEGRMLLAEGIVWLAGEIARPFRAALSSQELMDPKTIYGVEDRTTDVPFE